MHAHLGEVDRAREVLQSHGDVWGRALADFVEMEIRLHHGAVDEALPYGERAAAAFDSLRDDWGRSAVRLHLGHGLRLAGRTGDAEQVLDLAVELSRETGLPNNLARSYVELGEAALQRGADEEAEVWFDAAEEIAADVGSETLLALVLSAAAPSAAGAMRRPPRRRTTTKRWRSPSPLRFREARRVPERASPPRLWMPASSKRRSRS